MGKPDLEERLVAIRRRFHQYPELSGEEFETTNAIRSFLEQEGIPILETALPTGLLAQIRGKREEPIIALRADIDALPIQEGTDLPYASKIPGKMHACGHDFHAAALIGAAWLLKEVEKELEGTVRFIFQPSEEDGTGAEKVLATGLLKGVRAIFGLHNKPDLPVGTIGVKSGPFMASADGFVIEVKGAGTHAALPHKGIDPIVVAAHLVLALQTIVSRQLSPLDSAVLSVAHVSAGNTWNAIPGTAFLEGTVRTFADETRHKIRAAMERIVAGVADAHAAQASLRWLAGPPPVRNDERAAALCAQAAEELGLQLVEPELSMAAEDFAHYQRKIPGAFVFVGTSGTHEWHHPNFTLDERALPLAARFLAEVARKALQHFTHIERREGRIPT